MSAWNLEHYGLWQLNCNADIRVMPLSIVFSRVISKLNFEVYPLLFCGGISSYFTFLDPLVYTQCYLFVFLVDVSQNG